MKKNNSMKKSTFVIVYIYLMIEEPIIYSTVFIDYGMCVSEFLQTNMKPNSKTRLLQKFFFSLTHISVFLSEHDNL